MLVLCCDETHGRAESERPAAIAGLEADVESVFLRAQASVSSGVMLVMTSVKVVVEIAGPRNMVQVDHIDRWDMQ